MEDLVGKTLGGYQIRELIGQGGMATVYKAYQRVLDREVAIKILPPQIANDPEFTERFTREARAVAKLEHPHILPIYDFGQEGDLSYIAMRFVEGGTLADLAGKSFQLGRISKLLAQVASALDYAHSKGIVHRDVKPTNVLLDQGNWALLADFGIARFMGGETSITATGASIGTPDYMSPEQGLGQAIDHRSDIYSLGVMLYELLTGQVPFEADTPMAVIVKHIHDPLLPPRRINQNIPVKVERVIQKAMEKKPNGRFQSAGELSGAFDGAIKRAKTTVVVPSRKVEAETVKVEDEIEEPVRPKGRRKLIPILIPIVLVLGIAGIVVGNGLLSGENTSTHLDTSAPNATSLAPSSTSPISSTSQGQTTEAVMTEETVQPTNPETKPAASVSETQSKTSSGTAVPTPTKLEGDGVAISNVDGMELILIPEGEFIIGNLEGTREYYDQLSHPVFLDAYWMDKTEVTNRMFAQFLNEYGIRDHESRKFYNDQEKTPSSIDVYISMIISDENGIWHPTEGHEDFPVVNASWIGARLYCEWAGRRLPTEAEWEKAARGTSGWTYPWGDEEPNCEIANLDLCIGAPVNVGSYPGDVSPYGIYDMAGNVAEWTANWISQIYTYEVPEINPQGPQEGARKVVKGGTWYPVQWAGYGSGRADARFGQTPVTYTWGFIGFRCAMDLQD